MNAVRSRRGLLPAFGMLLVLAAAVFAQNNQQKGNTPAPPAKKGQPAHGPQPQAHAAPSKASSPAHKGPAGGKSQPGGSSGGTQNQGNRAGAGSGGRTQAGAAASHPAGGKTFGTGGTPGHPAGGRTFGTNGAAGRPSVVRTANTTVYRAPSGERRIVHNLPGGGVAVANARGHGYVQRSVTVRGSVFVQRTYYVGGRPQALYYRPYLYRGIAFNVYVPTRFWAPRFYFWAANPWAAPVYYNWGWAGTPWFGFYAGYFAPYPRYMGPNLWLTDYLLATSLQAAYQERLDAAAAAAAAANAPAPPPGPDAVAAGGQVTLSPEVKQAIADEVRAQLDRERAESQAAQAAPPVQAQAPQAPPPAPTPASAPPPALSPNATHVFIVSSVVVVSANGQQCAVTQGDVLQLDPAPAYPDPTNAKVLASKAADCQTGKAVQVGLADLQEMQNHMREMLDRGLNEMQAKQGQGNLPVIDASMRTQTPAPYAADLPAPDPNVANELQQTVQVSGPQEPPPPPVQAPRPAPTARSIAIGQTIDQVVAIMGQPVTRFDGPQKVIYVYQNLKITFIGGKVSSVQ